MREVICCLTVLSSVRAVGGCVGCRADRDCDRVMRFDTIDRAADNDRGGPSPVTSEENAEPKHKTAMSCITLQTVVTKYLEGGGS